MSKTFWYDDYKILFTDMDEFYPSYEMGLVEKLNAITRLSLYISVILVLLTMNYIYFYIVITIGLFTVFIYKMQKDNVENFFSEYDRLNCDKDKPCIKPTPDNPFMNFNNITDSRYRPPACVSYDNKEIKKEIENNFNNNLYRDVGDLYGKNNSQREFYTMPNTEVMNDQTGFAKWCYYQGSTCKEDSTRCGDTLWSPIETDQIFERFVNN